LINFDLIPSWFDLISNWFDLIWSNFWPIWSNFWRIIPKAGFKLQLHSNQKLDKKLDQIISKLDQIRSEIRLLLDHNILQRTAKEPAAVENISGQILKKTIITLQILRFKLKCLNQTCLSLKSIILLTMMISKINKFD
jgi:hypothetical protein